MFREMKKIQWFFRERKKSYIIGVSTLILAGVFEILPPAIVGTAIDKITRGDITAWELSRSLGQLALVTVIIYVLSFIWAYHIFKNSIMSDLKFRDRVIQKILRMPQPFFERFTSGDLMARASSDVTTISDMLGFGVLTFSDGIVYMATVILAMGFLVSWRLTLLCIIPLPFLAYTGKWIGKYVHRLYMKEQEAFSAMNDQVLEHLNGIRVVRSYVLEEQMVQSFEEMTQRVFRRSLQTEIAGATFWSSTKLFTTLSFAIAVGYGTNLVLDGVITLGQLIAFNMYLGFLIWPTFSIGEFMNIAQRGATSIKRIYEVLDARDDLFENEVHDLKKEIDSIQWQHYSFQYPSSQCLNLTDINLTIPKGKTLGIVGKTGSGKTTLVRQLLKDYPVGEGVLKISGQPIEKLSKQSLMQRIGYVSQDNVLFSKSVRENILLGKENATDEEIEQAVRLADLQRDIQEFSLGIETMVGERGISISGGQKQRISIARAIIKDPELLVMDDSLSAVDSRTESRIIENIRQNRLGKTTLIVTHRLSAVCHADEIVVLDEGKIVERGTHEELLNREGWYYQQYHIQKMEEQDEE